MFRRSRNSSTTSRSSADSKRSSGRQSGSKKPTKTKPTTGLSTMAPTPKPKPAGKSAAKPAGVAEATSPATTVSVALRKDVVSAVQSGDAIALQKLFKKCPKAASITYAFKDKPNSQETLLSLALLHQAPLAVIQTIHNAAPDSITQGNNHGMSALHQAATVATSLDVMLFLVTNIKTRHNVSVAQLAAPGNWSVIHIACRCGVLPLDTFEYLLRQARTALAQKTHDKGSTPLHLAILGLASRQPAEQRFMLQHLVQAFPYAVNTPNAAGYTPTELAQHQAQKTSFPKDMVGLLLDVQGLIRRRFSTRVQVEQSIERCQAKLDSMAGTGAASNDEGSGSFNQNSSASGASGGSGGNSADRNAVDKKATFREGMLAHIEMQMLLPLRKRFQSESELREIIEEKTKERDRLSSMGPQYLAQTMALNDELVQLEQKVQRELDALVPSEIQATRHALYERLQAQTHMLPISNVSLQYLKECTGNFSEKNRIGKGGFGSVYRGYDTALSFQYCVKKTEKAQDLSLLREVEVLARVFHPNIINLLGFYVPPNHQAPEFLVFEYAAGGTIADRVSSEENRRSLTWQIRLSAAVGVASGLKYLHHGMENKIYHHDVKPENIVFTETLDRAMLIDCGISKVLKADQTANLKKTLAGTPFYLPDDYTEDTPYDEKCEVFSFGMVLRILVSGKMPRALQDRTSELVVDPLAGEWPDDVLSRFMELTQRCVSKKASDRPTVEEIHTSLMQMESDAEKNIELTEKQQETINMTLAESRALSRASRSLEAFGQCFCSREKKKGLYCPGRRHFQCTECFNSYCLDYLGEEIYCRETCACLEPYTLDELHTHLKRSILCRHIECMMRNRELEVYKKANDRVVNELRSGFDRVMIGVTNLARDELQCPLLAILIPARSDRRRSVMRRALRSWKTATTKTFFLYFLCAHDRSLVQAPIMMEASRDWVKAATPFFRAVLAGLQVAVMVAGLPISIPMMESGRRDDSITDNLDVLDQMLIDVGGAEPQMERDMQQILQAMQGGSGERLSSESYRMVAELANQAGNTGWREKMVLAERNGELAWVKVENQNRWMRGTR